MSSVRVFALALGCVLLSAQRIPRQSPAARFPPEMVLDRFIDVARVAPRQYAVEMENSQLRVLRAKLSGEAKVPIHDSRSGVIVAITDVNLRFTTPDKKFHDIRVKAGETHWIDGDTFSEQNLSASSCEFLFVETMRPNGAVPYTPPN